MIYLCRSCCPEFGITFCGMAENKAGRKSCYRCGEQDDYWLHIADELPKALTPQPAPESVPKSEHDAVWDTLIKIADRLGIDCQAARSAKGKPSDVFIAAIEKIAQQPAQVTEGWKRGNLLTATQDDYPGLGSWFGQIWDGDAVVARVYGANHSEVNMRMNMLLAAAPQPDNGEQK